MIKQIKFEIVDVKEMIVFLKPNERKNPFMVSIKREILNVV